MVTIGAGAASAWESPVRAAYPSESSQTQYRSPRPMPTSWMTPETDLSSTESGFRNIRIWRPMPSASELLLRMSCSPRTTWLRNTRLQAVDRNFLFARIRSRESRATLKRTKVTSWRETPSFSAIRAWVTISWHMLREIKPPKQAYDWRFSRKLSGAPVRRFADCQ